MSRVSTLPRLADAKSALDGGDPSAGARIALEIARYSADPAEVAQALHFAGLIKLEQDEGKDAFRLIRNALLIAPERASAYANLVQVSSDTVEPLSLGIKAVVSNPESPVAWSAFALASAKKADAERLARRFEPAQIHSIRAVLISPDLSEALQGILIERRWLLCVDDHDCKLDRAGRVLARARNTPGNPMSLLAPHATLADQRRAAERVFADHARSSSLPRAPAISGAKVSIGYVSSLLKDHALAEALPELLKHHDRKRFDIRVYAAPNSKGVTAWNDAIEVSAGEIVDLGDLEAEGQANRIRRDGVQILADLDGFLGNDPLELLQFRPAPVLVNYFGFPGTCGGLHDYIIGDGRVIPENCSAGYTEHVVRMPHCYMPFDNGRAVPAPPSRKAVGLPEDALVLLAFHSLSKVAGDVFSAWMQILKEVPGSILWMLDHGETPKRNVRNAAAGYGIGADRIVFAPKIPIRDHVSRIALADLYLDSTWFNAHTTGADALWRGVPMVTVAGETFAARVGASLLTAAGLPDLIAHSTKEQAEIAISLLTAPKRLAALHAHMKLAIRNAPLFDMEKYTRALEQAYEAMAVRARNNQLPTTITIRP